MIMTLPPSTFSNNSKRVVYLLFSLLLPQHAPHHINAFSLTPSQQQHQQRHATIPPKKIIPNDSKEETQSIQSWRATSSTASSAKVVFTAPSSLDPNAMVQVKERDGDGWHTIGIVGGSTKSIYHGVFRMESSRDGLRVVDPCALGPSEYIRTMAAVACAVAVECTNSTGNSDRQKQQQQQQQQQQAMRFLHMGFGSGSLMRLLAQNGIPNSQHVAIELDVSVVQAAAKLNLCNPPNERVEVGDALTYQLSSLQNEKEERRLFDCVCIDVFDGDNTMPCDFYSVPFLKRLHEDVLSPTGFIVHNFHVGTEKHAVQLNDAKAAYREVFDGQGGDGSYLLCTVDSLNTNNHGGNTILLAAKSSACLGENDDEGETRLAELALLAQERCNIRFDLPTRVQEARRF